MIGVRMLHGMSQSHPTCPHCKQPLKLVCSIPIRETFRELLAYSCSPCQYAETKEQEKAARL
jgi:hypothetical protein